MTDQEKEEKLWNLRNKQKLIRVEIGRTQLLLESLNLNLKTLVDEEVELATKG